MADPLIHSIAPFFIVTDVERSVRFYCEQLGFEIRHLAPASEPFFAIVGHGEVQLFLKSERGIAPQPNSTRHPHLRWDAYVSTPDPDALAAKFARSGVTLSAPLSDTDDGLRGFELRDLDGYILFFGRPR